ncbi:hypothetical protein [Deinococcus marmoris]|uniref:hypothetical protein n=1 Tax=Deinococcus marmoris TaxID=249408 RepID=UPI0012DC4AA4|nr:hypothetical protein [Deinococcus marmoris]
MATNNSPQEPSRCPHCGHEGPDARAIPSRVQLVRALAWAHQVLAESQVMADSAGAAGLALSKYCQELASHTATCAAEISKDLPDIVMMGRFFWDVASMGINLAAAYEKFGDATKANVATSGAYELALVSLQLTDAAETNTLQLPARASVQA